jgi:hypothetical protein
LRKLSCDELHLLSKFLGIRKIEFSLRVHLQPVAAEIKSDAKLESKSVLRIQARENAHDQSTRESVSYHIQNNSQFSTYTFNYFHGTYIGSIYEQQIHPNHPRQHLKFDVTWRESTKGIANNEEKWLFFGIIESDEGQNDSSVTLVSQVTII